MDGWQATLANRLAAALGLTPFVVYAVCIVVLLLGVYQVFFHPLAKYPGPVLAKFTNLYAAYHAWKGDIHLDIHRCHQIYGDRLRYAPNRVIFNSGEAVREIYGHQSKVVKFKNYEVLARQAPNTLTIRDKSQHARRRRVVSQAFSDGSLRLFEPKMLARIDRFCEMLRERQQSASSGWTEPLDMAQEFNNLAFDMMTAVTFDMDFNMMGNEEYRYAMTAIENSNVRLGVLLQAPELAIGNLDRNLFPSAAIGGYQFVKFIRKILARRLGSPKAGSKDIFSFLQDCKDPDTGKGLSVTDLSTETATFIVAGADTSSTSMAALSHYLTGSSSWYAKASKEIRSTFSSPEEIRYGAKLNSCAILRACLDESLRMSPPGGSALWREVESGGTIIDGEFVPEGCEVGVGVYSVHHNAACFKDPYTFDASRWYRTEADKAMRMESSQQLPYMPFSVGPRSCVGKPLAIAQIMLVFARLLWEFDLRRSDSPPEWEAQGHTPVEYVLKDHLTAQKEGPVLCFRARD